MAIVAPTVASSGIRTARKARKAGTYYGRITQFIYLGNTPDYVDKTKKSPKLRITFEYYEDLEKPEMTFTGVDYFWTVSEKSNFIKMLVSLGFTFAEISSKEKPFDYEQILGRAVTVTLTQKGEYLNCTGIAAVPKGGDAMIPQPTKMYAFDFAENWCNFEKVPEFLQNKIKQSDEYTAKTGAPQPQVIEKALHQVSPETTAVPIIPLKSYDDAVAKLGGKEDKLIFISQTPSKAQPETMTRLDYECEGVRYAFQVLNSEVETVKRDLPIMPF